MRNLQPAKFWPLNRRMKPGSSSGMVFMAARSKSSGVFPAGKPFCFSR
jgi:hypothetical protein